MQRPEKPYLVTEDLPCLMAAWAKERGFRLPGPTLFEHLRQRIVDDLGTLFTQADPAIVPDAVVFLERDALCAKIDAALTQLADGPPFVTLDRHYFPSVNHMVDVTRVVSNNGSAWKTLDGIGVRFGEPSLDEQVVTVVRHLPQGTRSIRLLDDGFWSGTTTQGVSNAFQRHGINVAGIYVAIFVENEENRVILQRNDPPLHCLAEHFPLTHGGVIDWVCQRDFYPGVPFGGRTVAYLPSATADIGAYYLDPTGDRRYGDPMQWASLGGPALTTFSRRRLEDCILLFSMFETQDKRPVLIRDLDRVPYGMNGDPNARFVDVLKGLLAEDTDPQLSTTPTAEASGGDKEQL